MTDQDNAVVQAASPATVLEVISRAAADQQTDVAKLERLMELYERISAKQAEVAFAAALSDVQAKVGRIATDSHNPQTRSRYASYAALDRVLRPLYTEAGLSVSYDTQPAATPGDIVVLAYVTHAAGHTRTYSVTMPADGKGAKGGDVMTRTHATGSAITYAMRYLLKAIFNVAVGEDDDDGNQAASSPIDDRQAGEILDLLEATEVDRSAFLKWIGADSVEAIPANRYERAVTQLKRKLP